MTRTSSGSTHRHDYLPAFGTDRLLPLYDLFTRLAGVRPVHRRLLELAGSGAGRRVLEIGCGTGNLTVAAARRWPDAEVVGLDPDPLALARAAGKAARAGVDVRFEPGYAQRLPYPDGSFDLVLSALMLHHLERPDRTAALAEAGRVLRPGGALYLVDIGGRVEPSHGLRGRWQLRRTHLRHNLGDAIPEQFRTAGLTDCAELGHHDTRFGRVTFYRGALAV